MAHIRKTDTKPARTRIIQIRVTEEEFEQISRKASDAGMSISAMGRKAILRIRLYRRLSERECQLIAGLSDLRADLVNVTNALNGVPENVKRLLFVDLEFMRRWLAAVNEIVEGLSGFLNRVMQ